MRQVETGMLLVLVLFYVLSLVTQVVVAVVKVLPPVLVFLNTPLRFPVCSLPMCLQCQLRKGVRIGMLFLSSFFLSFRYF